MKNFRAAKQHTSRKHKTALNIFRAAVVDVKVAAAGLHFETLLSLLAQCDVDIGDIGHSIERVVDRRCAEWLTTPLPSTGLPPHLWFTIDKATPSRTTNQAIILVGRDGQANPCPIPVSAPEVYADCDYASYGEMAELVVKTISDHYSESVLPQITGVAADGPYQAEGFREQLLDALEITDRSDLSLPVTWDPAHLLNLGVTDVKDADNLSGKHFRRFIKRCNVFNTIMANEKGFAFLQKMDPRAKRHVSFATQRFASSSYQQWVKIEDSFYAYHQTFEKLYPVRIEEEEYQYMTTGFDYASDLLVFLDTLKPVVDLMLRDQSLDIPIWKLGQWWPIVKAKINSMIKDDNFPTLKKHGGHSRLEINSKESN